MPIDAEFDVTLHAGRAQIAEPQIADCSHRAGRIVSLYMDCILIEKGI
jgi:hypothetical protein